LLLFTGVSTHGSYFGTIIAPSLLVAIGIGLAFVPATITAVAGVAPEEAGLASGLVNTARLVGGALGLAVLAAFATARTDSVLGHGSAGSHLQTMHTALTSGFQLAFLLAAGFAAAGALVALIGLPRVPRRAAAPHSGAAALESSV
jgi:MFS family permease